MLTVTIFQDLEDSEGTIHENIDYVSLVSDETYGPPALVAPTRDQSGPKARPGETVLYINTKFVPLFEIERVD
jgi:hypothetical protein